MAHWVVSDPVEVRARPTTSWHSGVVTAITAECFCVTLNTPVTSDVWTGTTRKHNGSEMVTVVRVWKHLDQLDQNTYIRTPVA